MVMETAAAEQLLGDINRAIAQGLRERPILIDREPAIVIEWEGPIRRWEIREGFRPVLGETITLKENFLLLFHPRDRIEQIIFSIDPLPDPQQLIISIAGQLNRDIKLGLPSRSVTIERLPAFIASFSIQDPRWLLLPLSFATVGEVVKLTEFDVMIFASRDIATQVVQRLVAPPPKQVNIPSSVRQALHALQQREDSVEYGGGIDFEIMHGRAEVERLLVFLGGFQQVPGSIRQKFADDVELEFHTHPNRILANPSLQDLIAFSAARQKGALFIFRQSGFAGPDYHYILFRKSHP